ATDPAGAIGTSRLEVDRHDPWAGNAAHPRARGAQSDSGLGGRADATAPHGTEGLRSLRLVGKPRTCDKRASDDRLSCRTPTPPRRAEACSNVMFGLAQAPVCK